MTSRTGHVMASATLRPLEERLVAAQTAATAAVNVELVDGQSQVTSPDLTSTVSSDSTVITLVLIFFNPKNSEAVIVPHQII